MKKIIYLFVLGLLTVGCTTNFDEYNTNPNNMPIGGVGPFGLIEDVIYDGGDGYLGRTSQLNGELIQYTVHMHTENVHRYFIRDSYVSSAWNHLARVSSYADEMRARSEEGVERKVPEAPNALAIALTMRAMFVANWTDLWGEIPFTEAFQGRANNGQGNTKPKFDTQESIYKQLLEDLEKANSLFDPSAKIDEAQLAMIQTKDLLFKGDFAKWRRFANSLHLRLLMRLSNRDAEMNVSSEFARIVGNPAKYPLMASNSDNATLFFSGQDPFVNRYGEDAEPSFSSNTRRMAENLINIMDGYDDPRTGIYAKQQSNQWKGMVSGYPSSDTDATSCALLNKDVLGLKNSPYSFMRYDEVLFLLCEAAKRGMIPGGDAVAEEHYKNAILASINHWDDINPSLDYIITDLQREQFLKKVAYNGSLERILTQKYVAMFWVGYEAFCDYRRTGYPVLSIGSGTSNDGIMPTRFVYPITTVSTNGEHVNEAIERQGPDNMKTPVWWSKQAASK